MYSSIAAIHLFIFSLKYYQSTYLFLRWTSLFCVLLLYGFIVTTNEPAAVLSLLSVAITSLQN